MKVAVLTPSHGSPRVGYVQCLGDLLTLSAAQGIELKYSMRLGSAVAHQRSELAKEALEWGADWLLWIDDDQTVPPDTLTRLLAHGKPLIGCNIARRDAVAGPTAGRVLPDRTVEWIWTTPEKASACEVEEVEIMGLGVCLVAAEVLRALEPPPFRTTSEDYYFMAVAHRAGFRPFVDHALSWQVGHILETVRFNEHANADRDKWKGPGN